MTLSWIPRIIVLAPFAALAAPACAQSSMQTGLASEVSKCARLADARDRLACFDQVSGQAPDLNATSQRPAAPAIQTPSPASPRTPAPTGYGGRQIMVSDDHKGWTNREEVSGLDRSKTQIALLPAVEARTKSTLPQKAAIVVRCREGKTDFYVSFTDIVDGMQPVKVDYRINDGSSRRDVWQNSQDFQGYGTWNSPRTIPLLKELLSADELYVRGDAGAMGVSEARFKLEGMAEAIAPVRQSCRW